LLGLSPDDGWLEIKTIQTPISALNLKPRGACEGTMRTGAGSSLLPTPALAKATHWEEGAMTTPNMAHSGHSARMHGIGETMPALLGRDVACGKSKKAV